MISSWSLHVHVFIIVFASFPLLLLGECVFEPEQDKWSQNLLRKHMEGSWKFNEELYEDCLTEVDYWGTKKITKQFIINLVTKMVTFKIE